MVRLPQSSSFSSSGYSKPSAALSPSSTRNPPIGCDTFVAFPPTTAAGVVMFGKNSDRPAAETQSIRHYPRLEQLQEDESDKWLQCTYMRIPQVAPTAAVIISQIDWMWGCEHGANEYGVVIGNEAVWTRVLDEEEAAEHSRKLLGMDLVRLGLERGRTAHQALTVITSLLEEYGQGGPCAQEDESFTYHNSFLIADCHEAWVLETAGVHWVAQRITAGSRNISNNLTIRDQFDLCSANLKEFALQRKWWNGQEPFDFAACFNQGGGGVELNYRQTCGAELLQQHDGKGTLDRDAMMTILRDHDSGICMHGGFVTAASIVSELPVVVVDTTTEDSKSSARHWMTVQPHPCQSEYQEQFFSM